MPVSVLHPRLGRVVAGALGALALLGLAAGAAQAQAVGSIRGRVTEASSRQPVSEVQIQVVGTPYGALTNASGEFVIQNVPAGARTLRARRIGFAPVERSATVGASQTVQVDFELSPSATQLSDLVITGTAGAVERKTVGNSVTKIDVAELTEKTSVVNVTEVLQGKTPGVTILPGSGVPGAAGEIRIRGASSVSGYAPVVFIDGVRYNISDLGGFGATGGGTALVPPLGGTGTSSQVTSALNSLNPNDIESIEVIKGPAAATLYGAEAANGVIQIITKKGTRGQQRMRWSFRGERGENELRLLPPNNYTTCDAAKQALRQADGTSTWPGCQGVPTNSIITGNPFRDDPRGIRTGQLSRLSLQTRGGGDRYSFYVSGDRDVEQGVFFNSDANRTSLRSNITFNPNEVADFAINVNWQDGRTRLPMQDESVNGLLLSATRGQPGRVSFVGQGNEGWRTISPTAANRYRNFLDTDRLTLGATANFNPFSWLRNRLTLGLDNTYSQAQLLFLPGEIDPTQDPDAASGANLRRNPVARLLTADYAGTLTFKPFRNIESLTSFGSQVVADRRETLGATGIGIGAVDVTLINLLQRSTGSELFSENNSVGYYAQQQLGFKERLYLTGAVRADDHSSFGKNFDLIVYPKVSLSYVLSEEPAAKGILDALRVNSFKLRSAWGRAGRAPSAYSAPQTYTVDRVTLGTNTGSALRTSSFGNPDLEPERGSELEVGFDAGLFHERLGVDFTYYDKTTDNMLQSVSVAPSTGFLSTRLTNLGEVNNRGVELSLFGRPIETRALSWDARLNIATNRNELVSFGVPGKVLDTPTGQAYGSVQQHRPGYPLGGFWVIPPQRDAEGRPLLTPAGAAIFNTGDTARRYMGSSVPTREINFSSTFTVFRYVRLYGLLDHKGGFKVFNAQERSRCGTANDNCWYTNNPRARFPQTAADSVLFRELPVIRSTSVAPAFIQKGDFIKLREVSVMLDAPPQWLRRSRMQALSLVLSARNLALWSDYPGTDPEVNSYGGRNFVRVDAYALPMTRRLSASINIQY